MAKPRRNAGGHLDPKAAQLGLGMMQRGYRDDRVGITVDQQHRRLGERQAGQLAGRRNPSDVVLTLDRGPVRQLTLPRDRAREIQAPHLRSRTVSKRAQRNLKLRGPAVLDNPGPDRP